MTDEGEALVGSMDPRFAPVRIGDTVRRVAGASGAVVRALLLHLETVGFDGAPRHLGIDERGREVLSFIPGDVPLPPYPAWSMTDRALADLGALVRRFHAATATFVPPSDADWATDWADPSARGRPGGLFRALGHRATERATEVGWTGNPPLARAPGDRLGGGAMTTPASSAGSGTGRPIADLSGAIGVSPRPADVICHNDLFPENVVFRDGRVVALIDFAMAAPGRPLWDLAIAAEMWAPLGDPARRDQHPDDLDGVRRLGVLAHGYGLEPERAEDLVDVLVEERAHSVANIRAEIAAGNESWVRNWAAAGGDERAAADDAWIAANRAALIRAAGG